MRKVEHGVLDIRKERHAGKGVRVPEGKMSGGDGGSGEILRGIVIVDEIFPEECVAQKDFPEKQDEDYGKGGGSVPGSKAGNAAVSVLLVCRWFYAPRRRTHDARTLSTVMYCMQLFGHSGEK